MKKLLLLFFVVIYLLNPIKIFAAGSFELIDFPETFTAVVGQDFDAWVNFYYSGTEYKPKASIVGKLFPNDVKLGPVSSQGNSLYNILYSGIPKNPGEYPLTLTLSDDYGALLTKKFIFKVVGLSFPNNGSLPDAIVNKPYSYNLTYNYPYSGNDLPRIIFYDVPSEVILSPSNNPNARNGYFVLNLMAYKTGVYTFKGEVTLNNKLIGHQLFVLNVKEKLELENNINTTQEISKEEKIEKKFSLFKKKIEPEEVKNEEKKIEEPEKNIPEVNIEQNLNKEKWYLKFWKWLLKKKSL